jgi:hypothetical protein
MRHHHTTSSRELLSHNNIIHACTNITVLVDRSIHKINVMSQNKDYLLQFLKVSAVLETFCHSLSTSNINFVPLETVHVSVSNIMIYNQEKHHNHGHALLAQITHSSFCRIVQCRRPSARA